MIGLVPGQIITESLVDEPTQRGGEAVADPERDLAKIAVIERHLGTGRIGLGFVRGFGLRRGALGSTLSHDAHNAVVVGVDDTSMAFAVRRLANIGGGIVVVDGGELLAELPLPVAGILSDAPLAEVVAASEAVVAAARELGCEIEAPFQSLAFLALSVIPALKITDRGLVDVERFEPRVPPARSATEHRLPGVRRSARYNVARTMDDEPGTRALRDDGWVRSSRTATSRPSAAASRPKPTERVDLGGAVVTPGLVNTHHHLYQTLTRARAQEADLFTWLRELYPVWAGIDEESVYAAARTGLAELALSGCTTVFDHHYVFPRGTSGLIEAEVRAARELGVRIVASRGSMDLGESRRRPAAGRARRGASTPCSPRRSASPHSRTTMAACRSRSRRARRSR